MQNATWLNVSGCPRSGTTALGKELNMSKEIALLHEHLPRDLFGSIFSLFNNERFHKSLGAPEDYYDSIICADRDTVKIIRSIFSSVFNKSATIIGTKCPNLHKHETLQYPAGLLKKQIHITRNPVAVVNSYVLKGDGIILDNAEHAYCDWLSSLNQAIENYSSPDFLCLLYESFDGQSNLEIAGRIASFLGITQDFDLCGLQASPATPGPNFLDLPSGGMVFDAINRLFDLENWINSYSTTLEKGRMVGFPLQKGEAISLNASGNGWKYIQRGFYPAEAEGSWTHGGESILCLTPDEPLSGSFAVALNVSWLIEAQNEPTRFQIYLDDTLVGKSSIRVGKSNGSTNLFIFNVERFEQTSTSVTVRIVVENPRNPALIGISGDNRNLGLMIREISFVS